MEPSASKSSLWRRRRSPGRNRRTSGLHHCSHCKRQTSCLPAQQLDSFFFLTLLRLTALRRPRCRLGETAANTAGAAAAALHCAAADEVVPRALLPAKRERLNGRIMKSIRGQLRLAGALCEEPLTRAMLLFANTRSPRCAKVWIHIIPVWFEFQKTEGSESSRCER